MLLSQGRIEQFILDSIQQYSDLEVERGVIAESFEYDELVKDDQSSYPITVKLRTLEENEVTPSNNSDGGNSHSGPGGCKQTDQLPDNLDGLNQRNNSPQTKTEIVKAKYLIGCDGAHSWTRKQVDIPLEGSSTDHIWLVCSSSMRKSKLISIRGVIDIIPITDFRKF